VTKKEASSNWDTSPHVHKYNDFKSHMFLCIETLLWKLKNAIIFKLYLETEVH
jgi:hypothetical protein